MKKSIFLTLAISLFFASCTSTKIYPRIKCLTCVSKSDGILLMPLHWEPSFRKFSTAQLNELENRILGTLREEGFTNVELYDRMDYELLNAGVRDINDPVQRANINLQLGIPYLLGLSLGDAGWTGEWKAISPEEPEMGSYWESDTRVSSMLRIALFETAMGEIVSDYAVETTIDGIPIPVGDSESLSLNFGSIEQAVRLSVQKGIRNLVQDCSC
ncbi:hypothetical protein [Algoriphagus marincola]|uniref:hypothetical protein n=1 Tax=Algoriphagus marincola TaxID=264027 RepID=UPI0012DE20CD|nr:hypothetical protein [Algoriphagus marincola]